IVELADDGVELQLGTRRDDRARAKKSLKVRVAELQGHRAGLHAALAGAPAHPFRQRAEHRFDARRVTHVFPKRALVGDGSDGDAVRIVFEERGALTPELVRAFAARAPLDRVGPDAEDAAP